MSKVKPIPSSHFQQLLWEIDLPGEQEGKESSKMLCSNNNMAKETVRWVLSFYNLVLHVLYFDSVLLWRKSGQPEANESVILA